MFFVEFKCKQISCQLRLGAGVSFDGTLSCVVGDLLKYFHQPQNGRV